MSKRHRTRMGYRRRRRGRGRTISRCCWGGERGRMPRTNRKSFQSISEVVQRSFSNVDPAVDVDNLFTLSSDEGMTW